MRSERYEEAYLQYQQVLEVESKTLSFTHQEVQLLPSIFKAAFEQDGKLEVSTTVLALFGMVECCRHVPELRPHLQEHVQAFRQLCRGSSESLLKNVLSEVIDLARPLLMAETDVRALTQLSALNTQRRVGEEPESYLNSNFNP